MKKIIVAIALITGIAFTLSAQDYAVAAKEYCDCFKKSKDTMDEEFRQLLIRVVKQSNIKEAFANEMKALDVDKQRRFAEQLETLGAVMDSEETESGRCGIALDKKYEKYNDTPDKEKVFTNKLAAQLKSNKDCEFLWAVTVFALAFSEED
jgi:hypothetical protein